MKILEKHDEIFLIFSQYHINLLILLKVYRKRFYIQRNHLFDLMPRNSTVQTVIHKNRETAATH